MPGQQRVETITASQQRFVAGQVLGKDELDDRVVKADCRQTHARGAVASRSPGPGRWTADGRLEPKAHVVTGTINDFPETLQMLFRGENVGKLVLELDEGTVVR
jgi:hypothetical protein